MRKEKQKFIEIQDTSEDKYLILLENIKYFGYDEEEEECLIHYEDRDCNSDEAEISFQEMSSLKKRIFDNKEAREKFIEVITLQDEPENDISEMLDDGDVHFHMMNIDYIDEIANETNSGGDAYISMGDTMFYIGEEEFNKVKNLLKERNQVI